MSAAELFGRRIARARAARGWSLRELSAKSGVALSTISRAERGGSDLTLSNAAAVAAALGLSLDTLTAAPSCAVCDGTPPAGFTCQACGTGRPEVAP